MAATKSLIFDVSTCFGRGKITNKQVKSLTKKLQTAKDRVEREVNEGALGFWKIPQTQARPETLDAMAGIVASWQGRYDTLVVIGIGGSALGTRMLLNALGHRYHNELPAETRKGMKIYLLENDDPESFEALWSLIDPLKTVFNVISKSGTTAETASQFATVLQRMKKLYPNSWSEHFVFTTDPEKGVLRPFGAQHGIPCLDVPPDVGGRFSVLTPVGLLPALAAGFDIKKLLKGAEIMSRRILEAPAERNPALNLAGLHYLADRELNKNMVVVMPYADRLRDWTEWFCQLWAESLGKRTAEDGTEVHAGTTPIKALGAIDQHSQMQLYMEGPNDKFFAFLTVESFDQKVRFPGKKILPDELSYLSGHTMQELIQAEQKASRFALTRQGRLSYEIRLPRLNAETLGQLVFWAEATTCYAGYLYGVNPFDQPGVELGKKFAYGLMGREGFDKFKQKIDKVPSPKEDHLL